MNHIEFGACSEFFGWHVFEGIRVLIYQRIRIYKTIRDQNFTFFLDKRFIFVEWSSSCDWLRSYIGALIFNKIIAHNGGKVIFLLFTNGGLDILEITCVVTAKRGWFFFSPHNFDHILLRFLHMNIYHIRSFTRETFFLRGLFPLWFLIRFA
jgi:hypothetical protein